MKKILIINSVFEVGSTGRLCGELAKQEANEGNEVRVAYGRRSEISDDLAGFGIRIGNDWDVRAHGIYTRFTDRHGLASNTATRVFLRWAEEFDPDLLWLHNIHGYYINYEMLFEWIKSRPQMQVKWMLHDCWTFTGHCVHFSVVGCMKWKRQCNNCPLKKEYPKSIFFDSSTENYQRKKAAFRNVSKLELIVPSHWLERLVRESFLREYPIFVQPHTVDKSIFHPRNSDFRKHHGLEKKKLILGVANVWGQRKGLSDFLKLASVLDDSFSVVLVGLSEKQRRQLPSNIIGLPRTNNLEKLAEIYSSADVFVNPSLEETFGLTGLEAASCGTKTICYRGTACEEVAKQYGGIVIDRDLEKLLGAVREATE